MDSHTNLSPTDTWDGFMAFAAEEPLIGLSPHPGYAPQYDPDASDGDDPPRTAAAWAANYNAGTNRVAMEREATQEALDMQESGLEDSPDPDVIMRVRIDARGTVSVFDDNADAPFAVFTAARIYDAFGMRHPL